MMRKILVTYATLTGSTSDVAQTIANALRLDEISVDIDLVDNFDDFDQLEAYDAVVIGSAIRASQWLPQAIRFVEANQAKLSQIPVAYFTVCLTMREDTPENRQIVQAYMKPICQILPPIDIGLFAGFINYDRLSFMERMVMKIRQIPEGDYRNWELIRAWATKLRSKLLQIDQAKSGG